MIGKCFIFIQYNFTNTLIFKISRCHGEVNDQCKLCTVTANVLLNSRVGTATCKYIITQLMKLMKFRSSAPEPGEVCKNAENH